MDNRDESQSLGSGGTNKRRPRAESTHSPFSGRAGPLWARSDPDSLPNEVSTGRRMSALSVILSFARALDATTREKPRRRDDQPQWAFRFSANVR